MILCRVFKRVNPHPSKIRYVFQVAGNPEQLHSFATLAALVVALKDVPSALSPRHIKNEVAADIVWSPDEAVVERVDQYERLSSQEMHELAHLLRQNERDR